MTDASIIVTGIVGVAGVAGTLLAPILTSNRQLERERLERLRTIYTEWLVHMTSCTEVLANYEDSPSASLAAEYEAANITLGKYIIGNLIYVEPGAANAAQTVIEMQRARFDKMKKFSNNEVGRSSWSDDQKSEIEDLHKKYAEALVKFINMAKARTKTAPY